MTPLRAARTPCPHTRLCTGAPHAPAVNAWGVNIGNISLANWADGLGSPAGVFQDLKQRLADAGRSHLFVTAAGNAGQQLAPQSNDSSFFYLPAQLGADNQLTVGATGAARCAALCCARGAGGCGTGFCASWKLGCKKRAGAPLHGAALAQPSVRLRWRALAG